jgi:hypothetical protein
MAKRPGGVMVQGTQATRSQLIPVITKWNELGKTAQLGPVIFCIVVFFGMATFGSLATISYPIASADGKYWLDPREWIYTSYFLIMLAIFLTMVSLYFIYRMIGNGDGAGRSIRRRSFRRRWSRSNAVLRDGNHILYPIKTDRTRLRHPRLGQMDRRGRAKRLRRRMGLRQQPERAPVARPAPSPRTLRQ